jgi:hypothetical protein
MRAVARRSLVGLVALPLVGGLAGTAQAATGSPFGSGFDRLAAVHGGIEVAGWAIDPDTTGAIKVRVSVDGSTTKDVLADGARYDVAAANPGYGGGHGFATTLSAAPGTHRVCVTALNVGAGTDTALGCSSVIVSSATPGIATTSGTTATAVAGASRPNATNTGVPAGRTLRAHMGDLVVTTPGEVVDGLDVHGSIVVKADNVVIKNTKVRGRSASYTTPLIHMKNGNRNLTVVDSELVPDTRSPYLYGIIGWNFTLTRVEIQRVVDGVHIIGPNVTVRSSWIHNLNHFDKDPNAGGGPTHDDGVQIQSGHNLTIVNNAIDGGWNAAIQVTQDRGRTSDLEITGNYLDHGLCSVNVAQKSYGPIQGVVVSGNTFGRSQRSYDCAIVRPTTTAITASGNYFTDGAAVELRNA